MDSSVDRRDIQFLYDGEVIPINISRHYSIQDIESLLQNLFGVQGRLLGLKEADTGIFYIPSTFMENAITSRSRRFEVVFERKTSNAAQSSSSNSNPRGGLMSNFNPSPSPISQMSHSGIERGFHLDPNQWRDDRTNLTSTSTRLEDPNSQYLEGWSTQNSRIPTPNEEYKSRRPRNVSSNRNRELPDSRPIDFLDEIERMGFNRPNELNSMLMPRGDIEGGETQRAQNLIRQRLTDRFRYDMERPMSPFPRKDKLMNYVNSLATFYIQDKEDVELLQKLIQKEDEFVMAAFDLFESDKDQENLLDTLIRIVRLGKCSYLSMILRGNTLIELELN